LNLLYPAKIKKGDDGRYFVKFLDIKEAITEGETLEEALFNASEVLTLSLEGLAEDEFEIPDPSDIKAEDVYQVAPSARVQSAILLRKARGEKTISDIARLLETSWAAASRLEDPKHWPRLKQLEKAAAVLGKQVVISFSS